MGLFINKGNVAFRESRNGEYVDKSGLIAFMNGRLNTEQKFVCVTRARRFGKTMAAKMLYAYYDRSCDSRSLFDDLEIARMPGYEKHLNKYPVIFLDISKFLDRTRNVLMFIDDIENAVSKELCEVYPAFERPQNGRLAEHLATIAGATGERFIIIVDEWDAPLRELGSKYFPCEAGARRRLTAEEVSAQQDGYISFLRGIFKNDETAGVIAGAYLTGILPIIRYNTQSAMNNFQEFNMISADPIGRYIGFTPDEVEALCNKYGMDYAQMKAWYDGYQAGSTSSVFNPNSVISAIMRRRYMSYWTATGAGDELAPYLRYELGEDVEKLIAGDSIYVKTSSFDNKLDDVDSRDKVFTALIHLGYLSYDGKKARIPNMELMLYFGDSIQNADFGGLTKALQRSEMLLDCMLEGRDDEVARLMGLCHDDICGAREYNSEQGLYTTLREALFFARRDFVMHREYPTGRGFADMVLIPRSYTRKPAVVVELKYDKSVSSAIDQVKARNYPAKLSEYSGEVLLVGINYDKDSKEHQCVIEKVEV